MVGVLSALVFLLPHLTPALSKPADRCHNGGTPVLNANCLCPPDFEGDYCQLPRCYRGTPNNSSTCVCDQHWTGRLCDQIECVQGKSYDGKTCKCKFQYEGEHCDRIRDGECIKGRRSFKTYRCICDPGWEESEFCDVISCYNGMPRLTDMECQCEVGFVQPHCQKPAGWTFEDWYMIGIYVLLALVACAMLYVIATKFIVTFCRD